MAQKRQAVAGSLYRTHDWITVDTLAKAKKGTAMAELFATAPTGPNPMLNVLNSTGLEAWTARHKAELQR